MLLPALARAKGKAKAMQCLNNGRQIGLGYVMYAHDFNNATVPLEVLGTITSNLWVQGPNSIWWPDLLRPYLNARNITDCPSVVGDNQLGVVISAPAIGGQGRFGIGYNHIELSYSGLWASGASLFRLKLTQIAHPSTTIAFGDAGLIQNFQEPNPDNWYEYPGYQLLYFLTPSHPDYKANNPYRVLNRHLGRCVAAYPDGHSAASKASAFGFQYYPGKDPATGTAALGDAFIGVGNGRYDERWRWGRDDPQ
jgi:hypothetical protein